jgi:hypothetical protein
VRAPARAAVCRSVPRYFLDLPDGSGPRRWDPHAGPGEEWAETRYFAAAFRSMEPALHDQAIDVVLTWNTERLPTYGERVVAVVQGDEVGRIPRYAACVRAVFKCYGTRPTLGTGLLGNPGLGGLASLAQCGVRWLRWLPGAAAHARSLAGRRRHGLPMPAPVTAIPLGTYNQIETPMVQIDERPTDIFFAGSIEHVASLRHRVASPKTYARRAMLAAVERLATNRPDLRMDIRITPDFGGSEADSPANYSRALMNARICLTPRGTSLETFRTFEGLRCGCVVVGERLPRFWFYEGSPVVELDRWADLDDALRPLLDDPAELRRQHERSLAWWREVCSEAALGRFLAARLNDLELRPRPHLPG